MKKPVLTLCKARLRTTMRYAALLASMMCTPADALAENNSSLPPLAQQVSEPQEPVNMDLTIGVCHLVNSTGARNKSDSLSPTYVTSPARTVSYYFSVVEHKYISYENNVKVTLLQEPAHGTIREEWGRSYRYTPATDYLGSDQATFLVEIGGYKANAVYHFKVIDASTIGGNEREDAKNCPNGWVWKLSLNQDDHYAAPHSFEIPSESTNRRRLG